MYCINTRCFGLAVTIHVGPRKLPEQHSLSSDRCQWHCAREEGDEPSSLAAESEPLLGPHLEDYWSHGGLLGPLWRTIG